MFEITNLEIEYSRKIPLSVELFLIGQFHLQVSFLFSYLVHIHVLLFYMSHVHVYTCVHSHNKAVFYLLLHSRHNQITSIKQAKKIS